MSATNPLTGPIPTWRDSETPIYDALRAQWDAEPQTTALTLRGVA